MVFRQIRDVIFEQDETWLPAGNIESAEHLDFMAFDVDGEKIEMFGRASFFEYAVECPNRHRDDFFGQGARCHAPAIERGQRAGDVQRQRVTCIGG